MRSLERLGLSRPVLHDCFDYFLDHHGIFSFGELQLQSSFICITVL
jgi:hypothetical protein